MNQTSQPPAVTLSAAERALLDLVADTIVPPSADGRLPGASELGIHEYLCLHAADAFARLREDLALVERGAQALAPEGFSALTPADRQGVLDRNRAADPRFLERLALEIFNCYYQHDRVLRALAQETRAPFPKGYQVIAGDLNLLEPVRRRGQVYREA